MHLTKVQAVQMFVLADSNKRLDATTMMAFADTDLASSHAVDQARAAHAELLRKYAVDPAEWAKLWEVSNIPMSRRRKSKAIITIARKMFV